MAANIGPQQGGGARKLMGLKCAETYGTDCITLGVGAYLTSSLRYWVPLSPASCSNLSSKWTLRKADFTEFGVCEMLGIPKELGFGLFVFGFDPITICIKMGY